MVILDLRPRRVTARVQITINLEQQIFENFNPAFFTNFIFFRLAQNRPPTKFPGASFQPRR